MEKPIEETAEEREKRSPFYDTAHKIMLAAIGAASIAQEELDNFVSHLADRGQIAERDARKLAQEMRERRDKIIEERRAEWGGAHRHASKADVDALNARVAELTRELEELKRSQGQGGSPS